MEIKEIKEHVSRGTSPSMSLEQLCDNTNNLLDSQIYQGEIEQSFEDQNGSHLDLNDLTLFKPNMKQRKIIHKKKKHHSKTYKEGFSHEKGESNEKSTEQLPKSERKRDSTLLPEISNRNNSSEQLKIKNYPSLKTSKNKFMSYHR